MEAFMKLIIDVNDTITVNGKRYIAVEEARTRKVRGKRKKRGRPRGTTKTKPKEPTA
jgi:hypothetical protein